jgi:hypothetical protein
LSFTLEFFFFPAIKPLYLFFVYINCFERFRNICAIAESKPAAVSEPVYVLSPALVLCKQCENPLKEGDIFCKKCGTNQELFAPPPQQQQYAPPQ